MQHLFVYGTLMCPDIMATVSGLEREPEAATLSGCRHLPVDPDSSGSPGPG